MIHGNRQARAAVQSRAVIVLAAVLFLFVGALLATGVAAVEFAMPWKQITTVAAVGLVVGVYKLRERR